MSAYFEQKAAMEQARLNRRMSHDDLRMVAKLRDIFNSLPEKSIPDSYDSLESFDPPERQGESKKRRGPGRFRKTGR